MHRRPEFSEQKPDPSLVKPTTGPLSTDRNDNSHNPNRHHASTINDHPAKPELVIQRPPGPNATVNNRSVQPDPTTNTAWKAKNAGQQNSSRLTPNAGNITTNIYRPPPPKNQQPTNAPPTVPKQQPQQPAARPVTAEPATTSTDVDYMAGEDDMTFFDSEDEKWMMGDFDIELDVDLGRPIDFGADESAANQQDDSGFLDASSSGDVDPRKGTPAAPTPAPAQRNDNSSSLGPAQRSGGSNLVTSTSTGVDPNGNGNKEVSFQPLPNVRSSGNGISNGNGGKVNPSNSTSTVRPSDSSNGKPSAGGFSFPPGVVRCISSPFRSFHS